MYGICYIGTDPWTCHRVVHVCFIEVAFQTVPLDPIIVLYTFDNVRKPQSRDSFGHFFPFGPSCSKC